MSKSILTCQSLNKTFKEGGGQLEVLKDVCFDLAAGETVGILGRSGSGKSTLLHLLGGLDTPDSGQVSLQGQNMASLSEKQRCRLRNKKLGFIYQFHHLLPEFSALENVAMPRLIANAKIAEAKQQAYELLEKVGLKQRVSHKVSELSGGERQRVAIARALVTKPACILADEPTGNLDKQTAEQVFDTMLSLNQALQTSLAIVTHDEQLAARMQHRYLLEQGKLSRV